MKENGVWFSFTSQLTPFQRAEIPLPYVKLLWFIPVKWKSNQAHSWIHSTTFCSPKITLDCIDLHYRTEQKTTGGKSEKQCLIYTLIKVLKVLVSLLYSAGSSLEINEGPAVRSMHKNVLNLLSGFYRQKVKTGCGGAEPAKTLQCQGLKICLSLSLLFFKAKHRQYKGRARVV